MRVQFLLNDIHSPPCYLFVIYLQIHFSHREANKLFVLMSIVRTIVHLIQYQSYLIYTVRADKKRFPTICLTNCYWAPKEPGIVHWIWGEKNRIKTYSNKDRTKFSGPRMSVHSTQKVLELFLAHGININERTWRNKRQRTWKLVK